MKRAPTFFLFILLVSIASQLFLIPPVIAADNENVPTSIFAQNLQVSMTFRNTNTVHAAHLDTALTGYQYLGKMGNQTQARVTFKVWVGLWTTYTVADCFTTYELVTKEQPWIHEQIRTHATMPSTQGPDNWYKFTYDSWTLSGFKATGFSGNIPFNTTFVPLLNNAGYVMTSQVTETKIKAANISSIAQYNTFVELHDALTYSVVDMKDPGQSISAETKNGNPSIDAADDYTQKALASGGQETGTAPALGVEEGPVVNASHFKDAMTGRDIILHDLNNPAVGIISNGKLSNICLQPSLYILKSDITYDYWDRVVISTSSHNWIGGGGPGIYWPYSGGQRLNDVIGDRIVGWQVSNVAQIYEIQIQVVLQSDASLDAVLTPEGELSPRTVDPKLGNFYWDTTLGGGSGEGHYSSAEWYDSIVFWLEQYWWVILIILAVMGGFYVAFLMPTERGLLTAKVKQWRNR